MFEIADVEHSHEMVRADLLHLAVNLLRDAVGIARDQVAGIEQAIPIELGKIETLSVALAKIIE